MWLTTDVTWQLKKKAMIEALKKTLGIVTSAALKADVSRQTHYTWLENDPEYAKDVASITEMAIDFAESALHRQIQSDVPTSTIFYLKTRWKKRGYIEQNDVRHSWEIKFSDLSQQTNQELEESRKLLLAQE